MKKCLIRVEGTQYFNAVQDSFLSHIVRPALEESENLEEELFDLEDMFEDEREREKARAFLQRASDPHENLPQTELATYGIFTEEDGAWLLSYEESEITGEEGVLTTFCIMPNGCVSLIKRGGPEKTCLIFEKGKRHLCDYGADRGIPPVTLYTKDLKTCVSPAGGKIDLDYVVEIAGSKSEHNEFHITFTAQGM